MEKGRALAEKIALDLGFTRTTCSDPDCGCSGVAPPTFPNACTSCRALALGNFCELVAALCKAGLPENAEVVIGCHPFLLRLRT